MLSFQDKNLLISNSIITWTFTLQGRTLLVGKVTSQSNLCFFWYFAVWKTQLLKPEHTDSIIKGYPSKDTKMCLAHLGIF